MQIRQTRLKWLLAITIALILCFSNTYGDEITDSIKEALKAYEEGQISEAVESLNYASQLIQQQKGEKLQAVLPDPLNGWIAKDSESQSAGAAMFGGGISAKRTYRNGDQAVTIEILGESPMVQGMMMMLSNPMVAASSGGKLERIGRQKIIIKYNQGTRSGEITSVVNNRHLITIKGRKTSLEDIKAYAKAIPFKRIADLP